MQAEPLIDTSYEQAIRLSRAAKAARERVRRRTIPPARCAALLRWN